MSFDSGRRGTCGVGYNFQSIWLVSKPSLINSLLPAGARIEEFLYEKLDRKIPSRITNGELLGQYMVDAASEFGPGTSYGELLKNNNHYRQVMSWTVGCL